MTEEPKNRLRRIPLHLLLPHPENSNFLNAELLKKLRRNIERGGMYEPLIARPHPTERGKFQIVNGNNRLRVLKALSHKAAHCLIWNIGDDQARLYLATLNRLVGNDIQERRAVLIENLQFRFGLDELSALVPENRKRLEKLNRLARLEPEESDTRIRIPGHSGAPVMFGLMLGEDEAQEIDLALDFIVRTTDGKLSRGQALAHLAHSYLLNRGSVNC